MSPAPVNGAAVSDGAVSDDLARLTDEIVTAIKTVYDPEKFPPTSTSSA